MREERVGEQPAQEGGRQRKERQPGSGLGVRGGGAFPAAALRAGAVLLAEGCQAQHDGGDESAGQQDRAGLLLEHTVFDGTRMLGPGAGCGGEPAQELAMPAQQV